MEFQWTGEEPGMPGERGQLGGELLCGRTEGGIPTVVKFMPISEGKDEKGGAKRKLLSTAGGTSCILRQFEKKEGC